MKDLLSKFVPSEVNIIESVDSSNKDLLANFSEAIFPRLGERGAQFRDRPIFELDKTSKSLSIDHNSAFSDLFFTVKISNPKWETTSMKYHFRDALIKQKTELRKSGSDNLEIVHTIRRGAGDEVESIHRLVTRNGIRTDRESWELAQLKRGGLACVRTHADLIDIEGESFREKPRSRKIYVFPEHYLKNDPHLEESFYFGEDDFRTLYQEKIANQPGELTKEDLV